MRHLLLGSFLALAAAGCRQAADDDHDDSRAPSSAATTAAGHDAATGGQEASHDTQEASHDAQTLRTIMQGLSVDMQAFSHALFTGDSLQMVARAGAMADHAHLLPSEVQRISGLLGAEMPAFEAADERVHHGAERLHELSRSGQLDAVARQLGEVQQGCVACHNQFRERLRTDRP